MPVVKFIEGLDLKQNILLLDRRRLYVWGKIYRAPLVKLESVDFEIFFLAGHQLKKEDVL